MKNITRKNFLKTIGMAFAGLTATSTLAKSNDIDVNAYKNDPIGFIEKYFVLENGKNIKLRDYQKDYINKLSNQKFLICNKCRQAGITAMNIAFAYWKAVCFEDVNIVLVEPMLAHKDGATSEYERLFLANAIRMPIAQSSNFIFTTADSFNRSFFDETKRNIVIMDEFAFFSDDFKNHKIYTLPDDMDLIAISSTPICKTDMFGRYCDFGERFPHCYMKISGDIVFSKTRLLSIKQAISKNNFGFEYMNKYKMSSLS